MTRDEAVHAFEHEVNPAVFTASAGGLRPAREAHVYPLTGGDGFLWLEWGKFDLDDVAAGIKRGGREPTLPAAVWQAVAAVMGGLDNFQ